VLIAARDMRLELWLVANVHWGVPRLRSLRAGKQWETMCRRTLLHVHHTRRVLYHRIPGLWGVGSCLQVISPHEVVGVVEVVEDLSQVQEKTYEQPTVLVADQVRACVHACVRVRAEACAYFRASVLMFMCERAQSHALVCMLVGDQMYVHASLYQHTCMCAHAYMCLTICALCAHAFVAAWLKPFWRSSAPTASLGHCFTCLRPELQVPAARQRQQNTIGNLV